MVLRISNFWVTRLIYPLLIWVARAYKMLELSLMKLFKGQVVSVVSGRLLRGGITVNGSKPWDVKVNNPNFFTRLACDATLGVGEAYMDGWWDCDALDEFSYRVFSNGLYQDYMHSVNRQA